MNFWALFASQSLYQSAEQIQRELGLDSHGDIEFKGHTCPLSSSKSPVAFCCASAGRALTVRSPAQHPSTENKNFWHQSWHKAASFITICKSCSLENQNRWLFPPVTGWQLKDLHKFLLSFPSNAHSPSFNLIPGPEVGKFPVFDLMAPFKTATLSWINKSGSQWIGRKRLIFCVPLQN